MENFASRHKYLPFLQYDHCEIISTKCSAKEVRGKSKKSRKESSVPNHVFTRPHTKPTETSASALKKTRHHTERAKPWTEHYMDRKMTVDDYPSPGSSKSGKNHTDADRGGKEKLREQRGSEQRQPNRTRATRDRGPAASRQAEDRAPDLRHPTTPRRSLQRTIEPSAPTPASSDAWPIRAGPSNQGNRLSSRFRHDEVRDVL